MVFIRSLLRDPMAVGAVAPSSSGLSQLVASSVDTSHSVVLELGAGTGSITQALIERGISPDRLFLIERDPGLVSYLRERFPRVRVRCGDALHSSKILSSEGIAGAQTVISGLPMRNRSERDQAEIVREMIGSLAPSGQVIQYAYFWNCPIPARKFGLNAHCVGRVWKNLPPASVWRFTPSK